MEPPHLPSHQEDQVPLWGQRQRRQEDEVQNHCTTLVFRFHLALPHEDTEGARGREMQPFHVGMDPPAQAGHTDVPHPPPTHRCSSPAQGLRMLHLDPLRQKEIGLASTQISTG